MTLVQNEQGYWEARFRDQNNRRRSLSLKTRDQSEAKRLADEARIEKIEAAASIGLLTKSAIQSMMGIKTAKVSSAVQEWKFWMKNHARSAIYIHNAAITVLSWCREMFNGIDCHLDSVEEHHISAWINDTSSTNTAASRWVKLSHLRSFFEFTGAKGWSRGNPAKLVEVDMGILSHEQKEQREHPAFSDEQLVLLLKETEHTSYFWWSAIVLSRFTGLRLGDVASLEWASLSEPGWLVVWTRKRDKRVKVPVSLDTAKQWCLERKIEWSEPIEKYFGVAMSSLQGTINQLRREHESFVFPYQNSINTMPQYSAVLSSEFRKIILKVGLSGYSFHGLRRSYCTELNRLNLPIEHIANAVGHSNTSTTQRYIRE